MMKQKGYDKTNSYWDNLRGKPRDYENSGSECKNTKKSCTIFIIRTIILINQDFSFVNILRLA